MIELHVGDRSEIPLTSAAGSGSQWTVEPVAGEDAAEVGIRQGDLPIPDSNPPSSHVVPEILVVRAVRHGRSVWRLRLARPWTPDQPVAEHELEVVIA
jgi:hypothetical protein